MLLVFLAVVLFLNPGNEAFPIHDRPNAGLASSPSAMSVYSSSRSTFDIVWSCATTTFLCAWVSIHLDTTHGPENSRKRSGNRILFLLLAIVIPEFIVGWAMEQRLAAGKIYQRYNKNGWTTTHAHLLNMGGFALCLPEEKTCKRAGVRDEVVEEKKQEQLTDVEADEERDLPIMVDDDVVRLCFIETLNFDRFKMLIDEGSIEFPTITKSEIRDRAKSDSLSKFIAGIQTSWFILQCIMRYNQSLSLTELEVTTLALACLNVITLLFWWSKPKDVTIPVPVYLLEGSPEWYRRKAKLEMNEMNEEELRQRVREWGRRNADVQKRTEESEWHREESQWRAGESRWLERELERRREEVKRHKDEMRRREKEPGGLSIFMRGIRGARSFMKAGMRSLVTPSQDKQGLSRLGGFLLRGIGGVRHFLVAVMMFPAIHPHIDEQAASKQKLGQPISRQDLIEWQLEKDLGLWVDSCIHDTYLRAVKGFLGGGFIWLSLSNIGHGIAAWWSNVNLRRGWAMAFLNVLFGIFVILPLAIPFLVLNLAIVTLIILLTPLTILFFRFSKFSGVIDIYLATCVSKADPNKVRFYTKPSFAGEGYTVHIFSAIVIGTIFGALHCVAWNFTYPTVIEQSIWRAMSLTLTVIPSVFFLLTLPFMDPWPVSPVIAVSFFNRFAFLILIYLVARFTIVGLALVLLRKQPADAYLAVRWFQLVPHVS